MPGKRSIYLPLASRPPRKDVARSRDDDCCRRNLSGWALEFAGARGAECSRHRARSARSFATSVKTLSNAVAGLGDVALPSISGQKSDIRPSLDLSFPERVGNVVAPRWGRRAGRRGPSRPKTAKNIFGFW